MVAKDQLVGAEGRAKRDGLTQGKPQIGLVLEFRDAIEGAAKALAKGADKYGRGNWQKGMPTEEVVDSMMRHLLAYINEEDVDPEDGMYHTDKILTNALMLAEYASWSRQGIKAKR